MIMPLTQRQLADACHVSQPVVCQWVAAMHRAHRLDDETALMVLTVAQLRFHGLSGPVASKLIGQVSPYVRFAAIDPGHQCWIAFYEFEGAEHYTTSLTTTHLAAVMASRPMCLVIALHEIVARAAGCLEALVPGREAA
jgi:hypothetical protein